jgi:hypothetical protein
MIRSDAVRRCDQDRCIAEDHVIVHDRAAKLYRFREAGLQHRPIHFILPSVFYEHERVIVSDPSDRILQRQAFAAGSPLIAGVFRTIRPIGEIRTSWHAAGKFDEAV